jgi:hypothetical protein
MKTLFHEHDCDNCTHLDSVTRDGTDYDLYFCPQGRRPTVIARFGKWGEYISGLDFSGEGILKEAAELSIQKGLLSKELWIKSTK